MCRNCLLAIPSCEMETLPRGSRLQENQGGFALTNLVSQPPGAYFGHLLICDNLIFLPQAVAECDYYDIGTIICC